MCVHLQTPKCFTHLKEHSERYKNLTCYRQTGGGGEVEANFQQGRLFETELNIMTSNTNYNKKQKKR